MSAPLADALRTAIQAAAERGGWPAEADAPIDWQPGPARQGDIATPIAFAIAKRLGNPAPEVAQAIAAAARPSGVRIAAASGYLNLTLSDGWCAERLAHVLPAATGAPPRELRLALPDGPLTLGQARLAVLASVLARLLGATEGPVRLQIGNAGDRRSRLETLGVLADAWDDGPQGRLSLALQEQELDLGEQPETLSNWSAPLVACGRDAVRAALIASPGQPVRFVPPRETLEEPLFFLQYALARARRLQTFDFPGGDAPTPEAARALRVALALYADRLAAAATARAPWRLWTILLAIARAFHAFVRLSPPGDTSWPGYGSLIATSGSVLAHGLEALMLLSTAADI